MIVTYDASGKLPTLDSNEPLHYPMHSAKHKTRHSKRAGYRWLDYFGITLAVILIIATIIVLLFDLDLGI